jgi:murein DD-endopeptidase MepM/ murein hydrolase activator NlpD
MRETATYKTPAILALLLSVVIVESVAYATPEDQPCEDVVCVEVEKLQDTVTFYAISQADAVTISFSVSVMNMEPAFPPIIERSLMRGRTKLLTLKTIRGKKPQFDHGFFWEWGILDAKHDDSVSYRLPWQSGGEFRLFQGPNGTLTHQGISAYDFPMPKGTPVCAARGGRVIEVVDGFGDGGFDLSFSDKANKIVILHQDGTLAAYLHLLMGGMHVKPGDLIEAGAVIGSSGNSGRTDGPHLHFEVYRRMAGSKRETIPVKFHVAHRDGVVLEEKKSYRAE